MSALPSKADIKLISFRRSANDPKRTSLEVSAGQLARPADDQAFAKLESGGFAQNVVRRKFRHSAVVELYDACLHEGELAGQARVTDHIGKYHPC